jgi:hypothetical protein
MNSSTPENAISWIFGNCVLVALVFGCSRIDFRYIRLPTDNTLFGMKKRIPHRSCEKINVAGIHCPTKAKKIESLFL